MSQKENKPPVRLAAEAFLLGEAGNLDHFPRLVALLGEMRRIKARRLPPQGRKCMEN